MGLVDGNLSPGFLLPVAGKGDVIGLIEFPGGIVRDVSERDGFGRGVGQQSRAEEGEGEDGEFIMHGAFQGYGIRIRLGRGQ